MVVVMRIERRGFLKLGAVLIGALTLTKYAEPLVDVADTNHDWIEDRGDYLIVRVPDFKTFANEMISKPVIFILGEQAIIRAVEVEGFANIYAPKGGLVTASRFDGSRMVTEKDRPLVNLKAEDLTISECHFIGTGQAAPLGFSDHRGPMKTVQLADFRGDIDGRQILGAHGWRPA
jgi:hypothetical protein